MLKTPRFSEPSSASGPTSVSIEGALRGLRGQSIPVEAILGTLLPGQRSATLTKGRELLIAAEPESGASHLLRALGIGRAAVERLSVVLAAPDDRALREQHKDGEGGIWRMLESLPQGAVTWHPGGVARLKNGSTIQLTTWVDAAKRPADLLLIDDADELPLADFQRLRERALQGPARGDLPRLVVVAKRPDQGWIREHWRGLDGEGARVDLRAAELPEELRGQREAATQAESFGDWISRVLPTFAWYPHVELMVETAQRVVDGEILRLLVSAPPRYFKSLVWARLLPAYSLAIRPDEWVAVVSSSATLAEIMSGDARELYRAAGLPFRNDSQDKARWRTAKGGGMWARGVGGWALGVGYNLGIVDDPFASWQEAMKPGTQDEVESYFWKTFYGRRELTGSRPAAIVVNHQALAEGDLRGRILKREAEEKLPSEGWHVLNLPALKRARREPFPRPVQVIPELARWDGGEGKRERAEGEPLCPQLQDQDQAGLLRLEAQDARLFAATHEQEPESDIGGGMFERWWWSLACPRERVEAAQARMQSALAPAQTRLQAGHGRPVDALEGELSRLLLALMEAGDLPMLHREARAWDIAASLKGEGDSSASVRGGVAIGPGGRQEIVFSDAAEYDYPAHAVLDLIFETAQQDGPGVDVILPLEPAAAGKILIVNFQARLEAAGFRVVVVSTAGSKRVRAAPHAGAAAPLRNAQGVEDGRMGRCFLVPGPWNPLFCERHQKFDGVTKPLDLVDAASYLFSELDGGSFLTSGIR